MRKTAAIKELVLKNTTDSDIKQEFLTSINDLFELAHLEMRKLRKALAFQHNANESLKSQLRDNNVEPDEEYGRRASAVAR